MATILIILALVCFLVAFIPFPSRFNFVALGLAIYMVSLLVGNVVVVR